MCHTWTGEICTEQGNQGWIHSLGSCPHTLVVAPVTGARQEEDCCCLLQGVTIILYHNVALKPIALDLKWPVRYARVHGMLRKKQGSPYSNTKKLLGLSYTESPTNTLKGYPFKPLAPVAMRLTKLFPARGAASPSPDRHPHSTRVCGIVWCFHELIVHGWYSGHPWAAPGGTATHIMDTTHGSVPQQSTGLKQGIDRMY